MKPLKETSPEELRQELLSACQQSDYYRAKSAITQLLETSKSSSVLRFISKNIIENRAQFTLLSTKKVAVLSSYSF